MATITHILGYPRIGEKRELKFALEKYWRGDITDHVLTTTLLLGHVPARHHLSHNKDSFPDLDTLFRVSILIITTSFLNSVLMISLK